MKELKVGDLVYGFHQKAWEVQAGDPPITGAPQDYPATLDDAVRLWPKGDVVLIEGKQYLVVDRITQGDVPILFEPV